MLTYVIPTRNRHQTLAETLSALERLGPHHAEVLIFDNASDEPVAAPRTLASGVACRVVRLPTNIAAAARNLAITHAHPSSQWLIMLDDDSAPLDLGFISALREANSSTAIVAAEIFLPCAPGASPRHPHHTRHPRHESGGLPEVFVGCGAAIRTSFFRAQHGYDASFDYYAEEYDLSARALLAGDRVTLDRRFRVLHRKVTQGRDFGRILARLVRNNAWVSVRYAPDDARAAATLEHITRYARIGLKERALRGYFRGLIDLASTLSDQPRTPMSQTLWDRFTGLAAAREGVSAMIETFTHTHARAPRAVELVTPGKNAHIIEQALIERGIAIVRATSGPHAAEARMIGTLSPGPMLDAMNALGASPSHEGTPVFAPWLIDHRAPAAHAQAA
jgi:GT2 family glycosyltransferase